MARVRLKIDGSRRIRVVGSDFFYNQYGSTRQPTFRKVDKAQKPHTISTSDKLLGVTLYGVIQCWGRRVRARVRA
jgi:hypothetical protein